MVPFDIVRVLTAAAPIVASVASIANNQNSKPVIVEKPIERQEKPVNNISINITNNFYGVPEKEAIQTANKIQNDTLASLYNPGTRYII